MKITTNIECENSYKRWNVNEKDLINIANDIFQYYVSCEEILLDSAIANYNYKTVSFDFVLCDGEMTHQINKQYRNKDYAADIITFAVFADSVESERFVLDGDINLGEIIIALDKIEESAREKGIKREDELAFFVSHGILHLLGFDHQTEEEYNFVINSQKSALGSVGIKYDKV